MKLNETPRRSLAAALVLLSACAALAQDTPAVSQQPAAVQTRVDAIAPIELNSARDLMAMYGVDGTRLGYFNDGQPIQPVEVEPLLRVLMAVRRFSYGELLRWQLKEIPWSRWADEPYNERGEVIALRLKVKRVVKIEPEAALAARFNLEQYYRCEATIGDNQPTTIYALTVPRQWPLDTPIDERSEAAGFFLKLADAAPRPLHPIFVAQRLAWFPDTELGQLGMDVSLFEGLKNQVKFEPSDGPCFYELLAAAGRVSTGELLRLTKEEDPKQPRYSVAPLFNEPDKQFGKLLALSGTAKRCVRLTVENPDVIRVLGFDHYYQMEIFTADSQGNPITCCVRELPDQMKPGEDIDVDVRVAGFFFKTWKFPILQANGQTRWQLAPVLIGRAPVLLERPKFAPGFSNVMTTVAAVVAVVAVVGLWLMNRGDRQARKSKQRVSSEPVSFDGV